MCDSVLVLPDAHKEVCEGLKDLYKRCVDSIALWHFAYGISCSWIRCAVVYADGVNALLSRLAHINSVIRPIEEATKYDIFYSNIIHVSCTF